MLFTLKALLKRGALVAAANWPVIFIQAVTNSLFKLLIAAPLLGGIVLVTLIVGTEPGALAALRWSEVAPSLVAALQSRPLVLAAFLAAVGVVVIGGSLVVFLVKAGTVAVLVRGEEAAGPIERPPLRLEALAGAACFSIERFIDAARELFPRYARLGLLLLGIYLVSGAVYVALVFVSPAGEGWLARVVLTVCFAGWIALINLLYLLTQIVMAADRCPLGTAWARVAGLLRHAWGYVAGVFAIVLTMAIFATGASVLATALLGMIAFVPFFGLTVLPLQLMAWVLRGLVFEYIALASVGAYVRLYRGHARALAGGHEPAFPLQSGDYAVGGRQ